MFINYAKQYTDMLFLIMLEEFEDKYKAGRFLRASDIGIDEQHADWKPVLIDGITNDVIVPNGTMGQRWEDGVKGNLILENKVVTKINQKLKEVQKALKGLKIVFTYLNIMKIGQLNVH